MDKIERRLTKAIIVLGGVCAVMEYVQSILYYANGNSVRGKTCFLLGSVWLLQQAVWNLDMELRESD